MEGTVKEELAKRLIESLGDLQEEPLGLAYPCPRCGREMNPLAAMNALSRRAKVLVCSDCGRDEGIRDITGQAPLPFSEWSMVKGFWGGTARG